MAEDEVAYCLEEGLLVSAPYDIPSDPGARWVATDEHVPCSHVVCRRCESPVVDVPGFALRAEPSTPSECASIYDAVVAGGDAPSQSPWLTSRLSGATSRVYACRCGAYSVGGTRTLRHHGPDPWTCGGHPV
ncbi:MAG: hypothetical protein KC635_18955 [Myxococcales bacterium]|nr:hypothetical protein [Myxococcales bacterium]